jgi:hypothetical protein
VLAEMESDRQLYNGLPIRARMGWRFRETFYTKKIYQNYVRRGHVRVISLVREPIATNISMFFQLLQHYLRAGGVGKPPGVAALRELFFSEYNHFRPLIWLDAELKTTLGVDVYEHPFPAVDGFLRISTDEVDLLVIKSEIDDDIKSQVIADFLGLKKLKLVRANVAAHKSYADIYRKFKESIVIPERLLDEMYESKYARHFYSSKEIQSFRERWSRGLQNTGID